VMLNWIIISGANSGRFLRTNIAIGFIYSPAGETKSSCVLSFDVFIFSVGTDAVTMQTTFCSFSQMIMIFSLQFHVYFEFNLQLSKSFL
jgi:hypothetical protein